MSGSESSAPVDAIAPEAGLLNFSVHSLPSPATIAADPGRTRRGRWQMLAVLLICVAPVVASYLAFFGFRPQSLTNYSELILPPRPLPPQLPLHRLGGAPVAASSLRDQWLLVVVSGGACDAACEQHLWLQRQLHETLGAEKDRVDKVWLIDDGVEPRAETLRAIGASAGDAPDKSLSPASVFRVDKSALAAWLEPARGHALEEHFYIVDPHGDWMMRAPADVDASRLRRDVDKLLRASAGWDRPGR